MTTIPDTEVNPIRRLIRRRAARRAYLAFNDKAILLWNALYTQTEPDARAATLRGIAAVERELVRLHPLAFRPGTTTDEDGPAAAEAILAGTELVKMLATTEETLAGHLGSKDALEEQLAGLPVPEATLWRRLAVTPYGRDRADLIYQVIELATVRLGDKATETLRGVADITWDAAVGNARWSPGSKARIRTVIAAVALAAGVAITLVSISGLILAR